MWRIFSVFSLVILTVFGSKFPTDLPQCHKGDVACLPNVITQIIQNHPNGHKGLAIPTLEPLRVNSLDIYQGNSGSPVSIDMHMKNIELSGVSKAVVTKVAGFGQDPEKVKHEVHARIPKLLIKGDYKVNGQVLILPITGDGKATLILENVDIVIKLKPKIFIRDGEEYIKTDSLKVDMELEKANIHLTNLFNGNQQLSDTMNVFINENWRELFTELKPALAYAIEEIGKSIMNRIFNKIPYYDSYIESSKY